MTSLKKLLFVPLIASALWGGTGIRFNDEEVARVAELTLVFRGWNKQCSGLFLQAVDNGFVAVAYPTPPLAFIPQLGLTCVIYSGTAKEAILTAKIIPGQFKQRIFSLIFVETHGLPLPEAPVFAPVMPIAGEALLAVGYPEVWNSNIDGETVTWPEPSFAQIHLPTEEDRPGTFVGSLEMLPGAPLFNAVGQVAGLAGFDNLRDQPWLPASEIAAAINNPKMAELFGIKKGSKKKGQSSPEFPAPAHPHQISPAFKLHWAGKQRLKINLPWTVSGAKLAGNGRFLILRTTQGAALFDFAEAKPGAAIAFHALNGGEEVRQNKFLYTAGGDRLVIIYTEDKKLQVFSLPKMKPLVIIDLPESTLVDTMAMGSHNSETLILSGSSGGKIIALEVNLKLGTVQNIVPLYASKSLTTDKDTVFFAADNIGYQRVADGEFIRLGHLRAGGASLATYTSPSGNGMFFTPTAVIKYALDDNDEMSFSATPVPGTSFIIPSPQGDFFLGFPSRAPPYHPKARLGAWLHQGPDGKRLVSLPFFIGPDDFHHSNRVPGIPFNEQLFFEENFIAFLAKGTNQITLLELNPDALVAAAKRDYLILENEPGLEVVEGNILNYHINYFSRTPVRFTLLVNKKDPINSLNNNISLSSDGLLTMTTQKIDKQLSKITDYFQLKRHDRTVRFTIEARNQSGLIAYSEYRILVRPQRDQ